MDSKSNAYIDGWVAHMRGVENNPYDEQAQAKSYTEWTLGWAARYSNVKHGEDLSLDEDWQDE